MPSYSFRNTETGEEFDDILTISEREKFLEQNSHIEQLPSRVSIVGGHGDRIKNDGGWKDQMSRIAEANPGSPLADRYGKESTKSINTRNVLKKHGVI